MFVLLLLSLSLPQPIWVCAGSSYELYGVLGKWPAVLDGRCQPYFEDTNVPL
jgi:hypothetical protein